MMAELNTLLTGLVVGESPRWHDGRLWFCNWGAKEIRAVDERGKTELIGHSKNSVAGYSIDWLPSGQLLLTGEALQRQESDGTFIEHADLKKLSPVGWNEIVVAHNGNIYVNSVGFRFGQEDFKPGTIALVTPDGEAQQVADTIAFPNGMVITPDNKTLIIAESFVGKLTAFDIEPDGTLTNRHIWADFGGPGYGDGICMDTEGAIWCSVIHQNQPAVWRVAEGGNVLERIQTEKSCFECMLGGDDGRTLFMMVADWWGVERMGELFSAQTGQILTLRAPAPHAGRP